MRLLLPTVLFIFASLGSRAVAQIQDLLKNEQIDAMFAGIEASQVVHHTPAFELVFRVFDGTSGQPQLRAGVDELWFLRKGTARLLMGSALADSTEIAAGEFVGSRVQDPRRFEIGPGDIVNLPRGTAYQLNPGSGRLEYVAVRVFPESAHPLRRFRAPAPMPDVLKKSERDATFANNDSNQPLHSVRNLSVNYVIYKGHAGPWEAHRGCADIYFVYMGSGAAYLGGEIKNPTEEVAGEIRGRGVEGAREHDIAPGDLVLIPHNTSHYVVPTSERLGYNLVKVWAE